MPASTAQHSGVGGNNGVQVKKGGLPLRWRKPLLAVVAALVTAFIQRALHSMPVKSCPSLSIPAPAYLPVQSEDWSEPACSAPLLDNLNLSSFGCELWTDICIDQGTFISWDPDRAPGSHNYTERMFELKSITTASVPGHDPHLDGVVTKVERPRIRTAALMSGVEQPDVEAKRWSACTVPLVWWPSRHASLIDMFLDSVVPLYQAVTGEKPLIRDRRFKLVPATGGYRLPAFYHWLLLPFSKRPVEELHDLSSRQHRHDRRRNRCFKHVLLCNPAAREQPPPPQPAAAAHWMLDFYKASHPEAFAAAAATASAASQTLRIAFAASFVSGIPPLLDMCRSWQPTHSGGGGGAGAYARVECTALTFSEDSFVADLAVLHTSHLLVGTAGSPLVYGLFMPSGSTVVLLRSNGPRSDRLLSAFAVEKGIAIKELAIEASDWLPATKEVKARELKVSGEWPEERIWKANWAQLEERLASIVKGQAAS